MISLILMTMMTTFLQVSIMMKNMIDCLMGGISYWAIGHGLTVGEVNICDDEDNDNDNDDNDDNDNRSFDMLQ